MPSPAATSAKPPVAPTDRKKRFKERLAKHFFIRIHMSLILAATGLGGFIVNRLLYWSGVHTMAVRYGVAVVASYGVFLACIRLWLWYVADATAPTGPGRPRPGRRADTQPGIDVADAVGRGLSDLAADAGRGSRSSASNGGGGWQDVGVSPSDGAGSDFFGAASDSLAQSTGTSAGGEFFGGVADAAGESGSAAGEALFEVGGDSADQGTAASVAFFDVATDASANAPNQAAGATFDGSSSGGSGLFDSIGDAVGGLGDVDDGLGAIVAIIVLGVLVLVIFGAGGYLLWEAPSILTEAAFQVALAWGLKQRAGAIDQPGWVGSVSKATAIPFAVVLLVAVGCGMTMDRMFPGASTLTDVMHYDEAKRLTP